MATNVTYPENLARIAECDGLEIQPCNAGGTGCPPKEATYWCLFGHIPGEGIIDLYDVDTKAEAETHAIYLQLRYPNL
jgi:hypothetical protein